ncbi:hypothetical protein Tco_1506298 [Tanacetum coccineum]
MADVNVNAPAEQAPAMAPPTRTDDQILPRIRWVPIGKSNCYLDVERSQSNPIYKIAVDILKHTNFFRAFTTSSTIPSIYIQQFWDTIRYDKKLRRKEESQSYCDPSIRFTKLIIHHLQSKHKFHPRPDSSLHLPYEEYVLGYLKFSVKGTKHEVFGMPIPNDLITDDIRERSDPDSPTPKLATATKPEAIKKSKPSAPKATLVTKPTATKASKSTSSQQSKPAPAKRSKAGEEKKKRKPKSSLQLIDEFVDEGIPVNEPMFDDEEADMQKAVEETLKDVHAAHRGPLPPVDFREPSLETSNHDPEVQVKGKEKVIEEQVALDLLTLQTPKKKSPAEQYIFQRHIRAFCNQNGVQDEAELKPNLVYKMKARLDQTLVYKMKARLDQTLVMMQSLNLDQENLKLTVEEQVILEEPASSTGILSSLQHLTKDFSFGDQFFNDKPFDVENEKTTARKPS